ncbi:MAG: hypothetical protein ACHQ4H_18220 [Ktedonobacterales bacterium]
MTLELPNGMFTRSICCVKQDASGDWWPVGASSGTVNGRPAREQLWALLGGGGWPKQFYAGAYVDDDSVTRMRLRAANGVVIDDTIDHGVALFVTDEEITLPIEAELYDARGTLIGQQIAFQL